MGVSFTRDIRVGCKWQWEKGEGRIREKGESQQWGGGGGGRGIFRMFILIVGEGDTHPYAFVKPIELYKE